MSSQKICIVSKKGCFFYQKIRSRDRGLDKGQSRSKRFEQKDVLPSVSKRPADMSCDTKSSFSSKPPQIQADFPLTIHIKTRMVELTLLLPKTPPPLSTTIFIFVFVFVFVFAYIVSASASSSPPQPPPHQCHSPPPPPPQRSWGERRGEHHQVGSPALLDPVTNHRPAGTCWVEYKCMMGAWTNPVDHIWEILHV